MSEENFREVYRAHSEGRLKYTYFLLAAVGAAIALAVNQTHEAKLSLSLLWLAGAVLCWGLSFFVGCRHLQYASKTLRANAALLSGDHSQAASAGINDAMKSNANMASVHGDWQFRMLISGAVFYLTWHVIEMWQRTSAAGVSL